MTSKVMLVDLDACIRCYSCEIACRQENGLIFETNSRWCRVLTIGERMVGDEMHMDFVPTMCFHCDKPICASFCPADAISKRDDGIVVVDEAACIGCKQCVYGCPYGTMHFNEISKKAGKCNCCSSRMEDGIEPSCVQHCIGGALRWVTPDELKEITEGHFVRCFKCSA